MKSETFEQYLEKREKFFVNEITLMLQKYSGYNMKFGMPSLAKSKLDIIHGYVKEITSLHKSKYEFLKWKDGLTQLGEL